MKLISLYVLIINIKNHFLIKKNKTEKITTVLNQLQAQPLILVLTAQTPSNHNLFKRNLWGSLLHNGRNTAGLAEESWSSKVGSRPCENTRHSKDVSMATLSTGTSPASGHQPAPAHWRNLSEIIYLTQCLRYLGQTPRRGWKGWALNLQNRSLKQWPAKISRANKPQIWWLKLTHKHMAGHPSSHEHLSGTPLETLTQD